MTHTDLIEKLSKLDGPCRECDSLLAIKFQSKHMERGKDVASWFWDNFENWQGDEDGRVWTLGHEHERGIHFPSQLYTASIDASLKLVPEEFGYSLHSSFTCVLSNTKSYPFTGSGKSLPIAICIASLRAIEAMERESIMNAADEKAWQDYVDASETFFNNLSATKGGAEYLSLTRILCKAFLAGRASRNSEVEGLREVLRRYEKFEANIIEHGDWSGDCVKFTQGLHDEMIEVQTLRNQALTKGDSDASGSP